MISETTTNEESQHKHHVAEDTAVPETPVEACFDNSKRDYTVQKLLNTIKHLERTLEENEQITQIMEQEKQEDEGLRDFLQREVKQVRRELCAEKTRSAEQRAQMEQLRDNERTQPSEQGLKEDTTLPSVVAFLVRFGFPRLVMRKLVLMVWRTGAWLNQGISIFRVDNSWIRLESAKSQLEKEKLNLEEHVLHLQDIIYEKDEELFREKEFRMRLLSKLTEDKKRQSEHERTVAKLNRSVTALHSCVKNLNRELKKTIFAKRHEQCESIREDPDLHQSRFQKSHEAQRSPTETVRQRRDVTEGNQGNCHIPVVKTDDAKKNRLVLRESNSRSICCRCFKFFLVLCLVFGVYGCWHFRTLSLAFSRLLSLVFGIFWY